MPTPLPELLAQVPTLNDPAQPFAYEVVGETIVGRWDIVKAQSLYPTEFETIDREFTVTVEFNQGKGTFKSKDHESSSGMQVSSGGLSWGKSTFSGQTTKKEFSFTLGGVHNTEEGVSPVLAWSFDTDKIKQPLFAFLEAHGWARKKGLFG
jgi:hypothetical protein